MSNIDEQRFGVVIKALERTQWSRIEDVCQFVLDLFPDDIPERREACEFLGIRASERSYRIACGLLGLSSDSDEARNLLEPSGGVRIYIGDKPYELAAAFRYFLSTGVADRDMGVILTSDDCELMAYKTIELLKRRLA